MIVGAIITSLPDGSVKLHGFCDHPDKMLALEAAVLCELGLIKIFAPEIVNENGLVRTAARPLASGGYIIWATGEI